MQDLDRIGKGRKGDCVVPMTCEERDGGVAESVAYLLRKVPSSVGGLVL